MKIINYAILILSIAIFSNSVLANEEKLAKEQEIQTKINDCGYKILNSNQIENRIIFTYDDNEKESILKNNKTLLDREVIIYRNAYKNMENIDEMAAFIAREIVIASRSYDGVANGFLRSLQIKAAPKKFEIILCTISF